jgi:nucleoside-diphosphate-sugar epimerase
VLIDGAPHREVDKLVLAAGTDHVKTAIVCPSTVYGMGRGPVSRTSDQIPKLTQMMLQAGHGLQLGDGKAFWSLIHVYDLSRLYVLLVDEAVSNGSHATWNENGYYFAENGEFSWGYICHEIAKEAYSQNAITSGNIVTIPVERSGLFLSVARPIANYMARSRALRARKLLAWKPTEGSLVDEIPGIVRTEVARANST